MESTTRAPKRARPAGVKVITVSIPVDAYELLLKHSPTTRGRGDLLARLLFEYAARLDERKRTVAVQGDLQEARAEIERLKMELAAVRVRMD